MTGRPTIAQKRKLLKYLIERDGFKCYLCEKGFKNTRDAVLEHLNDNWRDNREDNLALAHQKCNVEKPNNNDFIDKSILKLEENESHMYVGESFLTKNKENKEASTEIEISNKCYEITESYLAEKIIDNGWILYNGLIASIVFLARQKIGHGSEQSIRSHIKALTSEVAPFEITKDREGKKIIKKR
jgi:ribosomal protein S8E